MSSKPRVDVWYSLQSDYCYFLLDRLIWLSQREVDVVIRPVLGLVLRMPQATKDRGMIEQRYFKTDTERTAAYLRLPYAYPDPSPIQFEPGSVWIATQEQPLIERLYRLFVGASHAGKSLAFLDQIGRGLWSGANPNWDQCGFLPDGMAHIGLQHDQVLESANWQDVARELEDNHHAMLDLGHWGVPLMAYQGEPFYGQDRFDQLLWRMGIKAD
ncbi:DsbA family protein [Seohaeicola saemankumensis]|jgi:2-hydroxychromene-2-carboxylate isomerase|uniref:DsbA family protein n=1 Tax=Seohaeicola TaxID=481178 RepID=UPI0035CF8731